MAKIDDLIFEKYQLITKERNVENNGAFAKYRQALQEMKVGDLIEVPLSVRQSTNTITTRLNIKVSTRTVLGRFFCLQRRIKEYI
jgi:ABC-type phosphate transport system auxiliary subunit